MPTPTGSSFHRPRLNRWLKLRCATSPVLSLLAPSSLALWAIALGSLPPAAMAATPFRDTQSHWARACVDDLAAQNKLNGYPDGTFRPENRLTRAEYAVLMLNSFPVVNPGAVNRPLRNFNDLSSRHWAYNALRYAYQRGIFVGYPDGTIRPDQPISRAEAIAVLYRLVSPNAKANPEQVLYGDLDSVPDFPIPQNPQAVLFELFGDADQVPAWAQPSLGAAAAGFMVVDYPHGNMIRPQAPTSRAEAAAFLCQAARRDGLVPTEAVAGYRYLPQSAELKKLLLAQTQGQQGWFDTQRERTVIATAPPGWRITKLGKPSENRVLALFEPLALLEHDENISRSGFFDVDGKLVIPPDQFQEAGDFSEGLASVKQAGMSGFIDASGKRVIPPQFREVKPFREGLAAARPQEDGAIWGFINKTGAWVIPPQAYRSVSSFSEGLARIEVPDPNRPDRSLYGFIDRTGEVAIAPRFTWAEPFADGLASVGYYPPEDATSVQWTYIDRSGQPQLDIPKEQFGSSFSEGLAVRGIESRDPITGASIRQHGFIDKTGQWVIEPQASFVTASSFRSGFAPVGQGSDRGLINRQGRLVTPPVFSDIQDISNGYAYVNYGGVRVNYTTYYNNDVPNYDSVMRGGRWGYVKLPSSYSPDSPYSEAFPGPEPSPDPLVQPFLVVNNDAPLPPLTSSEVTRLNNEASANIQSWLALAGVGASAPPTEFTEALQSWQQQQQATNPVTAPFLGLWQGEPPASGYPHYLGVIPANEANQVCLVEYQQGQQIAFEIFPATFVLSKATIAQGNLRSPRLRSVQSVSKRYPFENGSGGTTKVLSLLQATDNNRVRSFSLTDPSGLYDSFSPRMRRELTQSLSALGCTPENIRDRP